MATYGIDLGTTFSCIAYIDDVGRPAIARNSLGDDLTPSVVFFENSDNVVVGRAAKNSQRLFPELVVSLIKRQMGQKVTFDFHGAAHTPESISALILKDLAQAAEVQVGEPIKDVVVTVPAYFGLAEREATRRAGEIAGLNVLNTVPEPVVAALHYNALTHDQDRAVLVIDLGGGTFDTTVLRLGGNDINVVCTDGDNRLGGVDWDEALVHHLLERFTADHGDLDPAADEAFLQELWNAAEQLKKDLSHTARRTHTLRFDGAVSKVELTREEFEELTAHLLNKVLNITQRTVDTARADGIEAFDDVLLVGGSTRMPAVSAKLRERFGFEPRLLDPDLAVAKGAALFALIESLKITLPPTGEPSLDELERVAGKTGMTTEALRHLVGKRVTTVVPRAFGIKVLDLDDPTRKRSYIAQLLQANQSLPADSGVQNFYTAWPNQTGIEVEVWEQAGAVASEELAHNERIGKGLISDLPPLPEHSPIEVTCTMDELGTLRVYALELSTRKDLHIEVTIGHMSDTQARAAQDRVGQYEVRE